MHNTSCKIQGALLPLQLTYLSKTNIVMKNTRKFENRLQVVLNQKNVTQSQLAQKLGIAAQQVSEWCNNTVQPGIWWAYEIKRELKLPTVEDIFVIHTKEQSRAKDVIDYLNFAIRLSNEEKYSAARNMISIAVRMIEEGQMRDRRANEIYSH